MLLLIASEWERIWERKKARVILPLFGLTLLFVLFFETTFRVGFYDANTMTSLNSLNFSLFFLRDISYILTLIITPITVVDNLNGENASGAYRMILIRPYSRNQILTAKWISLTLFFALFVSITLLFGSITGYLFFPHTNTTSVLNDSYDIFGMIYYTIRFYGSYLLVLVAELSLGSVICTLMPNAILSYLGIIGFMIASIYISDLFQFFLLPTKVFFRFFSADGNFYSYLLILGFIISGYLISLLIWNRKDWLN